MNVIYICERSKCFFTNFCSSCCCFNFSFHLCFPLHVCIRMVKCWNAESHRHILKWCATRKHTAKLVWSYCRRWLVEVFSLASPFTNWNKCAVYVCLLMFITRVLCARNTNHTEMCAACSEWLRMSFFHTHISVYRTPETNFNGAEAFSVACLKWWVILSLLPLLVSLMDGWKSVCALNFCSGSICVRACWAGVRRLVWVDYKMCKRFNTSSSRKIVFNEKRIFIGGTTSECVSFNEW